MYVYLYSTQILETLNLYREQHPEREVNFDRVVKSGTGNGTKVAMSSRKGGKIWRHSPRRQAASIREASSQLGSRSTLRFFYSWFPFLNAVSKSVPPFLPLATQIPLPFLDSPVVSRSALPFCNSVLSQSRSYLPFEVSPPYLDLTGLPFISKVQCCTWNPLPFPNCTVVSKHFFLDSIPVSQMKE